MVQKVVERIAQRRQRRRVAATGEVKLVMTCGARRKQLVMRAMCDRGPDRKHVNAVRLPESQTVSQLLYCHSQFQPPFDPMRHSTRAFLSPLTRKHNTQPTHETIRMNSFLNL
jgi:hypothetical protein